MKAPPPGPPLLLAVKAPSPGTGPVPGNKGVPAHTVTKGAAKGGGLTLKTVRATVFLGSVCVRVCVCVCVCVCEPLYHATFRATALFLLHNAYVPADTGYAVAAARPGPSVIGP